MCFFPVILQQFKKLTARCRQVGTNSAKRKLSSDGMATGTICVSLLGTHPVHPISSAKRCMANRGPQARHQGAEAASCNLRNGLSHFRCLLGT